LTLTDVGRKSQRDFWYDGYIILVFYLVGQSSSHNMAAHLEETAFNSHVSRRPGGGL